MPVWYLKREDHTMSTQQQEDSSSSSAALSICDESSGRSRATRSDVLVASRADIEALASEFGNMATRCKELESQARTIAKNYGRGKKKEQSGGEKRETNLTRKMAISQEMASFMGLGENAEAARTDIVKFISQYAKDNNLKPEEDKRVIKADEKLAALLSVEAGEPIRFCDVQKHIKPHVSPAVA